MDDKWNRAGNADSLGTTITDYTPADANLPGYVKAVFFDADGTCTIKNIASDGTVSSAISGVPVIKGVTLPFVPGRVTAMTGPTKCFLVS